MAQDESMRPTPDDPGGKADDVAGGTAARAAADGAVAEPAAANNATTSGDVAGLGVDIVEIDRMRVILERTPSFKTRVYREGERAYCDAKSHPEVHYALFFAAKEAVLKALGTGFHGMKVTDVEVGHDRFGRPLAVLHDHALEVAQAQGIVDIYLSLSYTATTGVASAVAAKEEHRPRKDERADPKAELAAQFRELRGMLDEIDGKLAEIEQENPDIVEDGSDGEGRDGSGASEAGGQQPQPPDLWDAADRAERASEQQEQARRGGAQEKGDE